MTNQAVASITQKFFPLRRIPDTQDLTRGKIFYIDHHSQTRLDVSFMTVFKDLMTKSQIQWRGVGRHHVIVSLSSLKLYECDQAKKYSKINLLRSITTTDRNCSECSCVRAQNGWLISDNITVWELFISLSSLKRLLHCRRESQNDEDDGRWSGDMIQRRKRPHA